MNWLQLWLSHFDEKNWTEPDLQTLTIGCIEMQGCILWSISILACQLQAHLIILVSLGSLVK
jgi:hypothetical protein